MTHTSLLIGLREVLIALFAPPRVAVQVRIGGLAVARACLKAIALCAGPGGEAGHQLVSDTGRVG